VCLSIYSIPLIFSRVLNIFFRKFAAPAEGGKRVNTNSAVHMQKEHKQETVCAKRNDMEQAADHLCGLPARPVARPVPESRALPQEIPHRHDPGRPTWLAATGVRTQLANAEHAGNEGDGDILCSVLHP
jgi:hypothetical protein